MTKQEEIKTKEVDEEVIQRAIETVVEKNLDAFRELEKL